MGKFVFLILQNKKIVVFYEKTLYMNREQHFMIAMKEIGKLAEEYGFTPNATVHSMKPGKNAAVLEIYRHWQQGETDCIKKFIKQSLLKRKSICNKL